MNKKLLILNAALIAALLTGCGGGSNSSSVAPSLHTSTPSSEPSSQPSSTPSSESNSEAPLTLSPINTIKNIENAGTKVLAQGTLLAANDSGMFVKDDTGTIFVYTAASEITLANYKLGSLIKITGYTSVYGMAHQISSYKVDDTTTLPVEIEVVSEGSGEVAVDYQTMTIAELDDEDNEDVSLYGTPVVMRGTVAYNSTYNSPNCIVDSNGTKVVLSRHVVGTLDIEASRNKIAEIKGFIYCYESGSFCLVANELRELGAEDLGDAEAVDAAAYYISQKFDGAKTSTDIELPTSYLGATITWVSGNAAVLEDNGTYHAPSEATDVEFTVTIARGESSKGLTATITALVLTSKKVVISESYTAGGNKNSVYSSDFVELYNQTDEPVDLTGWSIQNASKAATSGFAVHQLSGTIKPHDYFLIRGKINTEDASFPVLTDYDIECSSFNPGATDYALALCSSTTQITRDSTGATAITGDIVDLLGVGGSLIFEGAKCTISDNTLSLQRTDPEIDTDNNSNDFSKATPTPTKSSSAE